MERDEGEFGAGQALLQGLIDYAGLFPPAKLGMRDAAQTYRRILLSPDAWMLGRFIVPVSRLGELAQGAADCWSDGAAGEAWPISALIDGPLNADLEAIYAFNRRFGGATSGGAVIDAIEIKAPLEGGSPVASSIDRMLDEIPDELFPFFEIPAPGAGADIRGCLAVLADADAAVKLRTGGVTQEAFPTAEGVAEFLVACAGAGVPFKATAGLHHALHGSYPLTYEPGCPKGTMHGFVNLFLAAGLVLARRMDAKGAAELLEIGEARRLSFLRTRIGWGERGLGVDDIERVRATFALSYGSCSFEEPVGEARELGLLG